MRKATPKPTIVRHSGYPEWGLGIVVEANSGKVHLTFENGGARAFVNDPKYLNKLAKVELAPAELSALVGKLMPKKADSKKKAKKSKAAPAEAKGERAQAEEGEEPDELLDDSGDDA